MSECLMADIDYEPKQSRFCPLDRRKLVRLALRIFVYGFLAVAALYVAFIVFARMGIRMR